MPKIEYISKRFTKASLEMIEMANTIIEEYREEGLDLTVRQLYYQFVARDLIRNLQSEYKKLGNLVSDGRLAGLIDWSAIVDRTRNRRKNSHWTGPEEIIEACAESFMLDHWEEQPYYAEVWIEKDALIGVIGDICSGLDVPYFACRGYNSQSEMWRAGVRLRKNRRKRGQEIVIFHLGDHDPSGIDMTRDIEDRLRMFARGSIDVRRLALNSNQIERYNPPPNPTKLSDTRAPGYIEEFGTNSWELDALDPRVIRNLIQEAILEIRDEDIYEETLEQEREYIEQLRMVQTNWQKVIENM